MAPFNNSLSTGGTGTPDDQEWTTEVGKLQGALDQLGPLFKADGYTLVVPGGLILPMGPYVYVIAENGADMAQLVGPKLNMPTDTAGQVRYLSRRTRRAGELKGWLEEKLAEINAQYKDLTDQLCRVAGYLVGQVKALDGTPSLPEGVRPAVNQAKGPILAAYDANVAGTQSAKQHNQMLIAHGHQQVASVQADLQVAQAENAVLRGGALGKDALQAPPAPVAAKKAGRPKKAGKAPKAPKTGKPVKPAKAKGKKGM